ncbi:hypothetical protein SDC9_148293 [bioreactor metagenome]|uniref:Uncharacterized protein n=1 Tax=bioreactor metagenome TaxID=1076179 RepID=A0A645EID9_9ZZZZ
MITISVISFRYPFYGFAAIFVHEFGRLTMTLLLHTQIQSVTTAGAFSTTIVDHSSVLAIMLIAFAGPLANFIVCSTSGGISFERTPHIIDPRSKLHNPFAIINLRLAVFSCLFNIGQFYL